MNYIRHRTLITAAHLYEHIFMNRHINNKISQKFITKFRDNFLFDGYFISTRVAVVLATQRLFLVKLIKSF